MKIKALRFHESKEVMRFGWFSVPLSQNCFFYIFEKKKKKKKKKKRETKKDKSEKNNIQMVKYSSIFLKVRKQNMRNCLDI